ncbi:MAG: DUF3343 domain-containing protein [Clostridia bacterium]|nr:DUF3343 domain-containing protein [Clostridia bacterium]
MSDIIVIVGSVTSATRLAKRINSQSVESARVISTPADLRVHSGCSYSVRTSLKNENIVRNNIGGLNIKGIYIEKRDGNERSYYDISR